MAAILLASILVFRRTQKQQMICFTLISECCLGCMHFLMLVC